MNNKAFREYAGKAFHDIIFTSINEIDYNVLFSQNGSRPNAPINVLISALILRKPKSWIYNELMSSIMFDLRTKAVLGLLSFDTWLNNHLFLRKKRCTQKDF